MVFAVAVDIFRIVLVVHECGKCADQTRATPALRCARAIEDLPHELLDQLPLVVFSSRQKVAHSGPAVLSVVLDFEHTPAVRGHYFSDRGTAGSIVEAARITDFVTQLLGPQ